MTAIKTCFSKYFVIEGRASRSEYWWFTVFSIILNLIAGLLDGTTGTPIFSLIVLLALLAPSICVIIRRMHDKDKSGWWYLLILIPIVGVIYILYLFVTRGTEGDNRFGPDPLR